MIVKMAAVLLLILLVGAFLLYRHYFPRLPVSQPHYPYALLLGCPNHDDGTYASSQIKRCELAIDAYKKGKFDVLIISGGAIKNQYVESTEMARYILKQVDMPILCETRASNTWENFQFSKEITKDKPVLILSGGTHIRRACAIARHFFKEYGAYWYKDHKPRHILRELISRYLYISIEIKKAIKKL